MTAMQLLQIDPASLLVDVNVRTGAALGKDFLASVREFGVLVPIVAVQTEQGVRVRYGHRRTLAAVQAGHTAVPVYVTGEHDADDAARIVRQWAENEHRAGLSTLDKLGAIEQLSLLGLSAAAIAKQTKTRRRDVDDALTVAGSALAKGAAGRWQFLTLDQMRTREGMKIAKAKGRLRDKTPKLSATQETHLVELWRAGKHTSSELVELFSVARSTVYRAVQRAGEPKPARRA